MSASETTSSKTKSASSHPNNSANDRLLQDIITALQQLKVDDEIIEFIKKIFKQFNIKPKTFEEYESIIKCQSTLFIWVDGLIAEGQTNLTKELDLFCLKELANIVVDSRKIEFMQYILNSPNKKEILFGNTSTEEIINKRYKKLSLNFHPDKTNNLISTTVTQDECRIMAVELFKCINELKDNLISTSGINSLMINEEKGNELWKIAIDLRNAHKGNWHKLKHLKKKDLEEIPAEKLKKQSNINGGLAYQEYRIACKFADNDKQLKSQIKLRSYMALSLYISDQFLEAQLYALASINLIYQNSNKCNRVDLNEAKAIFDKIKLGDPDESGKTTQLNTEININTSSNNSQALVKYKTLDEEYEIVEINKMNNSIKDDLKKISCELMFRANRNVVCWQANKEEILRAKDNAIKHQIVGAGIAAAGGGVGAIFAGAASLEIYGAVMAGAALGGPVGAALVGGGMGIGMLVLGLWGGHCSWTKGTQLFVEPKTREALNEIMKDALIAYDNGEHRKFIETLSRKYCNDECLIKLERFGPPINPENIIDSLLKHGFRPDGIAYLLNLIGEVLIIGKVKIEGITAKKLKDNGSNVLMGVLSKKLQNEANQLDERIKQFREKSFTNSRFRVYDYFLLRNRSNLATQYKDDAAEMPFFSRLEEMSNTARCNLAICYILDGDQDDIDEAKKIIKEIQESIRNNPQYIGMAETRLDALEDLLWIISGDASTFRSNIAIAN